MSVLRGGPRWRRVGNRLEESPAQPAGPSRQRAVFWFYLVFSKCFGIVGIGLNCRLLSLAAALEIRKQLLSPPSHENSHQTDLRFIQESKQALVMLVNMGFEEAAGP